MYAQRPFFNTPISHIGLFVGEAQCGLYTKSYRMALSTTPEELGRGPTKLLVPVENCRQSGEVDRRCEKLIGHELRIPVAKRTDLTVKAHIESIKAGLCQSWHCYSQDLTCVSHSHTVMHLMVTPLRLC